MATTKAESRKRKSQARTEVSSPSSSETGDAVSAAAADVESKDKHEIDNTGTNVMDDVRDEIAASEGPVLTKRNVDPEQAFEDFYLRQATKEFANDLDKLRTAKDFKAKSLSMLIDGLKQGTACFSQDERVKIGSAASTATDA